jgi:hypothetical protein
MATVRNVGDILHKFNFAFEVLTAVTMKNIILWDMTLCSPVRVYWRFTETS